MIKEYLNPWVIFGSVLVSSLLLLGFFLWVESLPAPEGDPFEANAALTVIPKPTETPTPAVPEKDETPSPVPSGEILLGGYVKIEGTGGDGLRLRVEPSLNAKINYLGLEDEVFHVQDGPVDQDGYQWWYLEAPADPGRNGWAVSNYLKVDQPPQQ